MLTHLDLPLNACKYSLDAPASQIFHAFETGNWRAHKLPKILQKSQILLLLGHARTGRSSLLHAYQQARKQEIALAFCSLAALPSHENSFKKPLSSIRQMLENQGENRLENTKILLLDDLEDLPFQQVQDKIHVFISSLMQELQAWPQLRVILSCQSDFFEETQFKKPLPFPCFFVDFSAEIAQACFLAHYQYWNPQANAQAASALWDLWTKPPNINLYTHYIEQVSALAKFPKQHFQNKIQQIKYWLKSVLASQWPSLHAAQTQTVWDCLAYLAYLCSNAKNCDADSINNSPPVRKLLQALGHENPDFFSHEIGAFFLQKQVKTPQNQGCDFFVTFSFEYLQIYLNTYYVWSQFGNLSALLSEEKPENQAQIALEVLWENLILDEIAPDALLPMFEALIVEEKTAVSPTLFSRLLALAPAFLQQQFLPARNKVIEKTMDKIAFLFTAYYKVLSALRPHDKLNFVPDNQDVRL